MRLKINFELLDKCFSKNYRSYMVSFIKHVLQTENHDFFNELYAPEQTLLKDFTFSVYVPFARAAFNLPDDKVPVDRPYMNMVFSIFEYKTFIHFYNMFIHYRGKEDIGQYPFKITDITLVQDCAILTDSVSIKFLSPLVIRKHDNERNTDEYIDCTCPRFGEQVNENVNFMLKKLGLLSSDVVLDLIPITGQARKTVVQFKKINFSCSYGQFMLKADSVVLNILYKTGMGSRRSEGFGLFEVIR